MQAELLGPRARSSWTIKPTEIREEAKDEAGKQAHSEAGPDWAFEAKLTSNFIRTATG